MPDKKIIVACDGTWVNSDNGFVRRSWVPWKTGGTLAIPSNVTRLTRAILPSDSGGTPQVCYYQAGLGSDPDAWSYFAGGYLGAGISEHIREAYAFVCSNYEPGDAIVLVGFSRGAFTARSILGLIAAVGLLTARGLADFYAVFRDWENQDTPGYYRPRSKAWVKAAVMPEPRPDFAADPAAYVAQLQRLGMTRPGVQVEAVAVWDTVGTLGVPRLAPWPLSALTRRDRREYAFVDCEIPPCLKRAYQALALDERRAPFGPTLWEMPPAGAHVDCRQVWLPGSHAGVGGGYADAATADVALAWIVARLAGLLDFEEGFLRRTRQANLAWLQATAAPPADRPWGCGRVYSSGGRSMDWLTGAATRTPGAYKRTDPKTGQPTGQVLRDTHERVHPCVRVRRELGGRGTDGKGAYNDPWPLAGWALARPGEKVGGLDEGGEYEDRWRWIKKGPDGRVLWLPEEDMEGVEWELVQEGSAAAKAIRAEK